MTKNHLGKIASSWRVNRNAPRTLLVSTLRSWLVATLCVYFLSLLLSKEEVDFCRIFLLTAWTGHSDVYGRSNKGCAEFHLDPTAPTSSVKRRWIVCTSGPSKMTSRWTSYWQDGRIWSLWFFLSAFHPYRIKNRHRYIFRSLSAHFPLIYRSFSFTFSFSFYKDLAKIK